MKYLFFLLLVIGTLSSLKAQKDNKAYTGVQFEKNRSWSAIKEKAKAENKYIFIDAWTTWCSPCLYMNKNVFPSPEVGTFFNQHFINVKLQLDTTDKDDEETIRWYQDAKAIKEQYAIQWYPTFLFISPEGELVHRGIGGSDSHSFVALGKEAIDSNYQFYTLKKKYEGGNRDASLLLTLTKVAGRAADDTLARKVGKEFLASQANLISKESLKIMMNLLSSTEDPEFNFFLANADKIDALLGKNKTLDFIRDFLQYKVLHTLFYTDGQPVKNIDWSLVEEKINTVLKNATPSFKKELWHAFKSKPGSLANH